MTTPRPTPRKNAVIELDQEDFQGEVVIHKNLSQDVVLTTEDKLRLALIQHRETLNSRAEWLGAGTLAFSFLSTLLLTTFKNIGMPISKSKYFVRDKSISGVLIVSNFCLSHDSWICKTILQISRSA